MLDAETKRKIDTARDVLVGKVPDPKSQVEQITIALIYKFMDDMDQESVAMGGKASFFTGEYEHYSWTNIFNPRLGGFEMVTLYGEALTKMSLNPNLPQLFRDIFKNAFLPFRDPETLKLFLKTINEFSYDQSERLGDAFEYLLQVMGSQGSAGQFLTPRHIINFMVQVVDPQKNETILDPACGTAGFLISAYRYILNQNSSNGTQGYSNGWSSQGNKLTPDERKQMMDNFRGYDISPDMVRLSRANLYLHGFQQPKIEEYDTLSSEEHWGEMADVILANPPFMSPKGGIRPHKKFMVQSTRSEVLFVDYIAEHLTPNGRGAVIVPEGIIFQTGTAYKQLRKYLVEQNILWAVVSLPAGVFNPYSGVKTSILFFDKALAKKSDSIFFLKVENDGFDLGAQRKPIDKNDLATVLNSLNLWKNYLLDITHAKDSPEQANNFQLILKNLIDENNDFNLSIERYKTSQQREYHQYPRKSLGEICTFEYGKPLKAEDRIPGEFPVFGSNGIVGHHNSFLVERPFIVIGRKGSAGEVHYSDKNGYPIDTTFYIKLNNESDINIKYLFHILKSMDLGRINTQSGVPGLNRNDAYKEFIPIPPFEIQLEIVAEIEGYQRIIDGARQVVDNWKPNIEFELEEARKEAGVEEWKMMRLGDVCNFIDYRGKTPKKSQNGVRLITAKNVKMGYISDEPKEYIANYDSWMTRGFPKKSDVLFTTEGPLGNVAIINISDEKFAVGQRIITLQCISKMIIPVFLYYILMSRNTQDSIFRMATGSTVKGILAKYFREINIPIPPLEIQKKIAESLENERGIIEANRRLIETFELKIKKVIERVWEA